VVEHAVKQAVVGHVARLVVFGYAAPPVGVQHVAKPAVIEDALKQTVVGRGARLVVLGHAAPPVVAR
jgi:hypothetical protein